MTTILPPGAQGIRFTRPPPVKDATGPKPRHTGILQDKLRRGARQPWLPSLSVAFRIILLFRFSAAMYSNIQDCDEVFNFWEPLHFLAHGYGFQTWEVSPEFSIRSWAYIVPHLFPAKFPINLMSLTKRQSFFAVRIVYAFFSTFAEAKFYRSVADHINNRVGRYVFFMLLPSAGMWSASTAFLPSTFALHSTLLACSYAFQLPSTFNYRRTLSATVWFALGAVVGWPFALLLSLPYVVEELFVGGADRVSASIRKEWTVRRWRKFFGTVLIAALVFIPVIGIDTLAYGKFTLAPWNVVKYNIFGGASRGPALYGTEPWYYYILNLSLAFNVLTPLALISPLALLVTHKFDYARLGSSKPGPDQSSSYTLMGLRLAPFFIWFAVLSCQPHKEERFMYPAYHLLCFNAAVTLYLMRGWMEIAYIKLTQSPYQATHTHLFRRFTRAVIVLSGLISFLRIAALHQYYHAPLDIAFHFQMVELPRLLNVTNLLLPPPVGPHNPKYEQDVTVDLTPLEAFRGDIRVCYAKEWYRFPGHFLIPRGIQVGLVKSEFKGLLPQHFESSTRDGLVDERAAGLWPYPVTRVSPPGFNDLNKEDPGQYIDISMCDYLVDVDFPLHPSATALEPRYAADTKTWDRVTCLPFLDASHSSLLTRTLWLPLKGWQAKNEFGDYCLLRQKKRAKDRETRTWT